MKRSVFLFSWVAMALVLVAALGLGTLGDRPPSTPEAQMRAIAETIKCPTCRSQSVADSDAPASEAIRTEILRQLDDGQDADEIRGYFASRYGEQILLTPRSSGVVGLVWILPIVALVVTLVGLGWAFRRWRRWET